MEILILMEASASGKWYIQIQTSYARVPSLGEKVKYPYNDICHADEKFFLTSGYARFY